MRWMVRVRHSLTEPMDPKEELSKGTVLPNLKLARTVGE